MRIVRLATGSHWTVCAACVGADCPVLEFVAELEGKGGRDSKRSREILADLTSYAPNNSSTDWIRQEFSTDLGNDIYEFRWGGKGGVPRVLWFYDENRVVVCVHATIKKDDRLDTQDMELAIKRRKDYFEAKEAGELDFVEIAEYENNK